MRSRSLMHLGALGLAAVSALLLVTTTSISGTTERARDLDHLQDETVAALDGITDTQVHQAAAGDLFMGLLADTHLDPAVLNSALDQANQYGLASNEAWARFLDHSHDLPGELALREAFENGLATGTAAATELGSVVFGTLAQGDVSAGALQIRLDAVRSMATGAQATVATLDSLLELYQRELDRRIDDVRAATTETAADIKTTAAGALAVLLVGWTLAMRSSARRDRADLADRHMRDVEARRNELDARLQRGLLMAPDESSALDLVGMALHELDLDHTAVLVADSSRAHFHEVVPPADGTPQGCGVATPNDCPAARSGQTQTFARSDSIDACPHLRQHGHSLCSAVCAPVNIAGIAVGVMSAAGAHGQTATPDSVANLELVARKTGERLGALRTFSKSETQARTDSLTGLLNRRSIETEAASVVEGGGPYAVAFGDLDHFKQLNDVYGHDTGDRALRLFARVLRDSVRPQDIPARYGGEEFVVVLPGCSAADAVRVVDRVRERLAESLDGGSTPPFTVSFGVASDDSGLPFADLVSMADAALLTAKADGRDRIVIGSSPTGPFEGVETHFG